MCVLISLVALAEEAAAAVQEKIEETAAAEFAILKLHLAQMSHQIVPDAAILGMSSAGLLVALNMLFQATDMDFLDHPQFRDTTEIDPAAYPDYMRHALVTSLHEQGVQFSSAMMIWLQPLSISACQAYDVATLWGNNPEYEFNSKLQQWTDKPLHDKHSNLMDALRYSVQGVKELDVFGENLAR